MIHSTGFASQLVTTTGYTALIESSLMTNSVMNEVMPGEILCGADNDNHRPVHSQQQTTPHDQSITPLLLLC